jgi:hypothetical protein
VIIWTIEVPISIAAVILKRENSYEVVLINKPNEPTTMVETYIKKKTLSLTGDLKRIRISNKTITEKRNKKK